MKKKIFSSLIAISLISTLFASTASAASAPIPSISLETEVYNAVNGISDIPITPAMLDGVSATITDKNGNLIEDVDVDMTVRQLSSRSLGTTYVATYVARANKTDSDTTEKDGVIATATVTWNDILGTTNELISVSGGWDVNGDSLTGRKVEYGSKSLTGETNPHSQKVYSNNFFFSPDDVTGYTLYVKTTATISSTDNVITLYVESKITT